ASNLAERVENVAAKVFRACRSLKLSTLWVSRGWSPPQKDGSAGVVELRVSC
ncbi:hypothetical protein Csa_022337, partial [Cucumis sativus]